MKQMMLVVYNVNGGVLTRVGDMNIGPAYIPSDMFLLPLDPNYMRLDNYDSGAQDFEFTWYCESDGTVTLESERYHYLPPYVEHMDGFDRLWFMMQMDETVIWIY